MQLLKSFFCLQGSDNRNRFLIISSLAYVIFLLINAALAEHIFISIILLITLVSINALTTLRRLNDAQLNRNWLIGPSISFFIIGLIIILTGHSSAYWLMLIPAVFSALLLTYPSKAKVNYILGYYGPVDLHEFDHQTINQQRHARRIEPTILSNPHNQEIVDNNSFTTHQKATANFTSNIHSTATEQKIKEQDIGETIRLKLFNNKNALFTVIIISSIVLFAVISSILISLVNSEKIETDLPPITAVQTVRLSPITLPDNFSLMLSQHHGLIINWQADATNKTELWSLSSAIGEQTCKEIIFNDGEKIRTTTVTAENGNEYFANFSPLDTKALLQAIAFRGNFSLCDYKFSLKGSQAILGKHEEYAEIIEY